MKELTVFILKRCPHCIRAKKHIETLQNQPEYEDIKITYIDERKESALAKQYDYYYVPSFYVGDIKLHEGTITLEELQDVFDRYQNHVKTD